MIVITPNVGILSRSIDEYCLTVYLTTESHTPAVPYMLQVSGVMDGGGNMIAPNTEETYTLIPDDTEAPELIAARLTTPTMIELEFNETLDPQSAETISMYTIDPAVTIYDAELRSGNAIVRLSTAEHAAGSYTVTVSGIGDAAVPMNILSDATRSYEYVPPDIQAPEVQAVESTSYNIVTITFSEPVDEATATDASNYSITPPIPIESASLANKRFVILITGTHEGGQYEITIDGIKDRADNVIASQTRKLYTYNPPDMIPPVLLKAELHGINLVELTFSEALDRVSAEDITHYLIDPSVEIQEADLVGELLNTVYLKTADHIQGMYYEVRVHSVTDRAASPNVVQVNSSAEYNCPLVDTEPPRLVSVELIGEHLLEVVFSEPLEQGSAETISNYTISPTVFVESATLDVSTKKVMIRTAKHEPGTDYRLIVNGVTDRANPANPVGDENEGEYTCLALDNIPPRLVRAEMHGASVLELSFSEALEASSATIIDNYSIDRGISVLEARVSQTQMQVFLETSPHTEGQYTVTVTGVTDLADEPNIIGTENRFEYTYTPADDTPPRLLSADISSPTLVELIFNETLDRVTAENFDNYIISGDIVVQRAILNVDMTTIILQTSTHLPGSYSVTLNNICDGSSGKNPIASNTVGNYEYVVEDEVKPTILTAALENPRKLIVEFSEMLDAMSAENIQNYAISNNIDVEDAFLNGMNGRVILETSEHPAGEYTLTVNAVRDASNAKNAIAPYSQIKYSWIPVDTIGPQVTDVVLQTNTMMEITFSEPIGSIESKNVANYSISPPVEIYNAILNDDWDMVWLITAPHDPGVYTITVNNIKDRAFTPNAIESNTSLIYDYTPPDTEEPQLVSAKLKQPMLIELVFDEELDRTEAETVSNYSIDSGIEITQASLFANLKTIYLETSPHQELVNYTLTISNLMDRAPIPNRLSEALTYQYQYTPPDNEGPELLSATLHGATLLELIFNEALEIASAEKRSNYFITPGVEIQSANLDTTTMKKVLLGTTLHLPGMEYNINVSNVRDRAPVPNVIADNTWFQYSLSAAGGSADKTAPQVIRVDVLSETKIDILFTESIDKTSAENIANYIIDGDIEIISAVLDTNSVRVHLTTSEHVVGQPYAIQIQNIRDRASQPNVLAAPTPISYFISNGITLSTLSRSGYMFTRFNVGGSCYVDRNYTIIQVPQDLEGSVQVLTANDDKAAVGDPFLSFELCGDAKVYVAYDAQIDSLPAWMADWQITGEQIVNSHDDVFHVYMKEFGNERVMLGGNEGSLDDNMYLIFVDPQRVNGGVLSSLSKAAYQLDYVDVGDTYYIDRDYTIASIPDSLEALLWIRTSNEDKADRTDDFLQFQLSERSMIYVGYDARIGALPKWLGDWELMDEQIVDSRSMKFDVFSKEYDAGEVVLGGNYGSLDDNMYVILIQPLVGGPPEQDSEVPGHFTLTQNYPNPFNPITTIPYMVEKEGHISLMIFNVLGQVVKTLVDENKVPDRYTVEWDGTNEQGLRVASGVYFFRLQQGSFAKTRRMLLMR